MKQKINYIDKQVNKIIKEMEDTNSSFHTIATCNYRHWDKELHHSFPDIAEKLKEKGYRVTSELNWGVTDWTIVKPITEKI